MPAKGRWDLIRRLKVKSLLVLLPVISIVLKCHKRHVGKKTSYIFLLFQVSFLVPSEVFLVLGIKYLICPKLHITECCIKTNCLERSKEVRTYIWVWNKYISLGRLGLIILAQDNGKYWTFWTFGFRKLGEGFFFF